MVTIACRHGSVADVRKRLVLPCGHTFCEACISQCASTLVACGWFSMELFSTELGWSKHLCRMQIVGSRVHTHPCACSSCAPCSPDIQRFLCCVFAVVLHTASHLSRACQGPRFGSGLVVRTQLQAHPHVGDRVWACRWVKAHETCPICREPLVAHPAPAFVDRYAPGRHEQELLFRLIRIQRRAHTLHPCAVRPLRKEVG